MATVSVEFFSDCLKGFTDFKLILPNDLPPFILGSNPHFNRPMKTLILLHGYSGSNTDWIYNTRISELAGRYNLAVVCPQGGNSFYLDGPETGRQYASFIGRELPAYVSKTFGLSPAGEDVFIGGFSMGGFGAIHTALAFPEQFSKVLSFSAALIHRNVMAMAPGMQDGVANYEYYKLMFGEPSALAESVNNPEYLAARLKAAGRQLPELFMSIGTEDFLYEDNKKFRAFLTEQGIPFTYEEAGGMHNFDTVSKFLEHGLEFLCGEV